MIHTLKQNVVISKKDNLLKVFSQFLIVSHCCEGYFLLCNREWPISCNFPMNMAIWTPLLVKVHKNADFIEKFLEINLFETVTHGYTGGNIFCNHEKMIK